MKAKDDRNHCTPGGSLDNPIKRMRYNMLKCPYMTLPALIPSKH
jgi:hypothetical protein